MSPGAPEAEDAQLAVLARSARLRALAPYGHGPVEGAAVRDADGRTYTGATVELRRQELGTTALRAALLIAAASGARGFEAAVVATTAGGLAEADAAVLAELAPGARLHLVPVVAVET